MASHHSSPDGVGPVADRGAIRAIARADGRAFSLYFQLANLAEVREGVAPQSLNHFQRLRAVKVTELEQNFNQQKGRYASMCKAIAKKTKVEDETYPRTGSCWWWLRRAASGGTDELALLFGRALRDYDPDTYKTYASSLPKELKAP